MKIILLISCIIAISFGAPASDDKDATIITYESNNNGLDKYNYKLETSNEIKQEESGELVSGGEAPPDGKAQSALKVQGKFSFKGPDDVVYTVTYTADENGFQPQGAHLPVAP